jgi:hypothetical protein
MRVQSDAESSRPRQAGSFESSVPTQAQGGRPRLRWRAVIHPGQKLDPARGLQPVAWHLADCDDPARAEAHCDVGRHLLASDGNPDGHCRVGGVCPRCPVATSPSDQA